MNTTCLLLPRLGSINQPTNQSTNQPTNQPTNQRTCMHARTITRSITKGVIVRMKKTKSVRNTMDTTLQSYERTVTTHCMHLFTKTLRNTHTPTMYFLLVIELVLVPLAGVLWHARAVGLIPVLGRTTRQQVLPPRPCHPEFPAPEPVPVLPRPR